MRRGLAIGNWKMNVDRASAMALVDAIVAEGFEAGGHNGYEETTTMALIPSITLAELGIRGSVIIYFTELFISDFTGTLSASIVLWFINLAIPAIIGSFFMYRIKV